MANFDLGSVLDIPFDEEPLYQIESVQFAEAVDDLSDLVSTLVDSDMFTEAKVDRLQGGLTRTKDLTAQALDAYGNVTTGVGDVMHGGATITLKLATLASKVIKFICKMISAIPLLITKVITDIGQVTSRTFMELTGEMSIYLTEGSLNTFDNEVKKEIDHFISITEVFTGGDEWTTGMFSEDFKRYNKMKAIHRKLNGMRYEPTTIKLNTQHARDTYFNPKSAYYAYLTDLNKFFINKKPQLTALSTAMETKIATTENSGNFYKLNAAQRLKAEDTVRMISSFMSVIGKYFKYVQEDLLTIRTHMKRSDKKAAKALAGDKPETNPPNAKPSATDGT